MQWYKLCNTESVAALATAICRCALVRAMVGGLVLYSYGRRLRSVSTESLMMREPGLPNRVESSSMTLQ